MSGRNRSQPDIGGTLLLYTESFPFGDGESFLATELIYLCAHFDRVIVLPYARPEGAPRAMPPNAQVELLPMGGVFPVRGLLWRNWRTLMAVLLHELPVFQRYRRRIGHHFAVLLRRMCDAEILLERLRDLTPGPIRHYSYWFAQWGTVLALAHHRTRGRLKFVTRVHGYDLDVLQRPEGFIPYRRFEMRQVAAIAANSRYSQGLVRSGNSGYLDIHLHHLGVEDPGPLQHSNAVPWLASCGYLVPSKRTLQLIEVLRHMRHCIHWVHFGDGPERKALDRGIRSLPKHIRSTCMGRMANGDILAYYRSHPGGILFHPSALEGGMPVAVMEALSFGMPVIGCATGGVPEGVNATTGLLLPLDFDPASVAAWLDALLDDTERLSALRSGARKWYEDHFQAGENHRRFVEEFVMKAPLDYL
jgi:glycosyltransferase involved in cell wall biosynthesis